MNVTKKVIASFVFFLAVLLVFSAGAEAADGVHLSGIAEAQLIDIGGPWLGGQLRADSSLEIPGRHFQPEEISLTYITSTGYNGHQLRGSLLYDMSNNFYTGYGVGYGRLGSVSFLMGTINSGMEVKLADFLRLRGELIGYVPVWQMTGDKQQKVFYGINVGLGF